MAQLPWLFLTPESPLTINPIAADIFTWNNLEDFLFYIDNGMLCVLIRMAFNRLYEVILIRTHNIPSC